MAKRYPSVRGTTRPRIVILSQAQVSAFVGNLRRACDEIERGEQVATVGGVQRRRITPLQTLRNQAQWLETLFLQQNGARRMPEAWDSIDEPENWSKSGGLRGLTRQ